MGDHLTPDARSRAMALVKSKNTTTEMRVRRVAHKMGYRYRLHRCDLPGKPDLLFPRLRKAIFVHGCFWHFHKCKRLPASNVEFWKEKLENNRKRDRKVRKELRALDWDVLVIWECQTKDEKKLMRILTLFLSG